MRLLIVLTVSAFALLTASGLALDGRVPEATAVVSLCPGDFNGDGVVSGTDVQVWGHSAFTMDGESRFSEDADANGDGIVNVQDFIVWRNNFGAACD